MSAAPEGFKAPTPEQLKEWLYAKEERIGIMTDGKEPTAEQTARAVFEADRHIESLYPGECNNGWISNL